ncbi:F-box domain-containing protein [Favolaschia claudopus]|uniref:F-box domain-containing protein n=1 Tax=Favolaschia claudopus TaxID=2862362 RepID=A0AAW0AM55_9AGAR
MLDFMEADRAFVAEKDAEILELEAQIAVLISSISELHAAKQRVQQRLDSYRYPVLTLPTEIIGEIFLRFLPPYPKPPPPTGILSPTSLTQICRQWRNIALSTPALWRAINVDPAAITAYQWMQAEYTASLLQLWLERSSPYPLSIRVVKFDASAPLLPILLCHQARWEHFEASCYIPRVFVNLALDAPMPLLRSFSLRFTSEELGDPKRSILPNAPLLRTVSVDDCGVLGVALPWSQLTSLNLRCLYPEECMPIFQHALRLVHCTLDLWDGSEAPQGDDDQHVRGDVVLPRLETFIILPSSDTDPGFLSRLIMPALLHLSLPEVFLTWPEDDPIPYLKELLAKYGCQLQELQIFDASAAESLYRSAFPSISSIVLP